MRHTIHPTLTPRAGARAVTAALAALGLVLGGAAVADAVPVDERVYQAPPIPGQVEQFDFYGWELAVGDFDGDRYDDLVTAASDESLGGIAGAGAVIVVYGSPRGLVKADNQRFHQNTRRMPDQAEATDKFSEALATGDFDGDGYDDLAVGVPAEDRHGVFDAGVVHVLFGSPRGLKVAGNQLVEQAAEGIQGRPADGDRFGGALAAGDVDGDGRDDLLVGTDGDTLAGVAGAGSISVVFGGRNGLTKRDQLVSQASGGIADDPETGDAFGHALAAGDLDADGFADVAVGTPNESFLALGAAGSVHVLFGSRQGLQRSRQLHQGDWGAAVTEADDEFGGSVAIGRHFNGRGKTLMVGAPGEDDDTGWAGQSRLDRDGLVKPFQRTGPVLGWRFGEVVALGAARHNELAFRSAPTANGDLDGIDADGGVVFSQIVLDQDIGPWSPALNDGFGLAVAPGDFDHDGWVDVAVGIPFKDIGGLQEAGAVSVFYKPQPDR